MTSPIDTTKEQWGIGRLAEYRPEHYFFQRTQSREMNARPWEDKKDQKEPWWLVCLGAGGYVLFCIAVFMLLSVVGKI